MSDPNADSKRKQYLLLGVAGGGILAVVGASMFYMDNRPTVHEEKPKVVSLTSPGNIEDRDVWRTLEAAKQKASEDQIKELSAAVAMQAEQLKKVGQQDPAKPFTDPTALNQPLPTLQSQRFNSPYSSTGMAAAMPSATATAMLNKPINSLTDIKPVQELEMIQFSHVAHGAGSNGDANREVLGFPVTDSAKKFSKTGEVTTANGIEFIPAGSFVRAVMLNGIDAPTGGQAQSNPLPVALHVMDTASLANKYQLNIKDCRFIAAAWGDLSSERGMARTETLTCIINDETVELPIKGQIIGEDGKAGMRGRLVTKQGQILANALLAGIANGIGQAFQQSASTQNLSPLGNTTSIIRPGEVGQAALGAGMGNAGNALEQYYLKAADKLFPVIEIDGGRTVEVLVTKGAVYTGKTTQFNEHYRGMLNRTGTGRSNRDED